MPAFATDVWTVLIVPASEPAVAVEAAIETEPEAPAARPVKPATASLALVAEAATVRVSW